MQLRLGSPTVIAVADCTLLLKAWRIVQSLVIQSVCMVFLCCCSSDNISKVFEILFALCVMSITLWLKLHC